LQPSAELLVYFGKEMCVFKDFLNLTEKVRLAYCALLTGFYHFNHRPAVRFSGFGHGRAF
jgi:hypothetical protein